MLFNRKESPSLFKISFLILFLFSFKYNSNFFYFNFPYTIQIIQHHYSSSSLIILNSSISFSFNSNFGSELYQWFLYSISFNNFIKGSHSKELLIFFLFTFHHLTYSHQIQSYYQDCSFDSYLHIYP